MLRVEYRSGLPQDSGGRSSVCKFLACVGGGRIRGTDGEVTRILKVSRTSRFEGITSGDDTSRIRDMYMWEENDGGRGGGGLRS
jgi:hypothetical protein